MTKIYIMKSGTYFIGDLDEAGKADTLKNTLEVRFVERRVEQNGQQGVALVPELFAIGYPLNMKAQDIPIKDVTDAAWFEMEDEVPLNFVKYYMDKVSELNSPIVQPKQQIIK